MGQSVSTPIQENLQNLHSLLMTRAGAEYDIVTATTLTYDTFLSYIQQLNKICADYKDERGHVLVFAVKRGTDSASVLWRATVRVACVNYDTSNRKIISHRLLNIRQFLQVFRRITYECTNGAFGVPSSNGARNLADSSRHILPTEAASSVLGESLILSSLSAAARPKTESCATNLEECIICLEDKPDVILPCAHAYCLPCIEQWWEYCDHTVNYDCSLARVHVDLNIKDKSCPVCRESLSSTDDTWVLSEAPDDLEVGAELKKSLISLSGPGSKIGSLQTGTGPGSMDSSGSWLPGSSGAGSTSSS